MLCTYLNKNYIIYNSMIIFEGTSVKYSIFQPFKNCKFWDHRLKKNRTKDVFSGDN